VTPLARSPLRGRYLVRNRGWNAALRVTDAVLSAMVRRDPTAAGGPPRRILVAVGGHLGDAVIATSVFPALATAFPEAAIGMLLPSWSRAVVDDHPRLRWIHHADHWKMNRGAGGAAVKWSQYRRTAGRMLEEVRTVGYDVAIDLYAYYPNAAWLLWRAGIPTRIGYTSGGCGPLYTRALDWRANEGHTADQHRRLLRELGGDSHHARPRYDLPPIAAGARDRAAAVIRDRYVVVHPGAGDARKVWPSERWCQLVRRLADAGERIAITGRGEREVQFACDLQDAHPPAVNLAGQLDWPTFRAVVSNASLVVGSDSAAAHIAAASGVPTIAVMAAMSNPEYWRPMGSDVVTLTRALPCAPCFRKNGCQAMSCVRDVSVDEVFDTYRALRARTQRGVGAGRGD
jgi:lipopolysaccharide heptosyltransferase II